MKLLTNQLKTIYQALTAIEGAKVYHYEKPAAVKAPYIIWHENGEGDSFCANNHKENQVITGAVDLYTKTEFDPLVDSIQAALDNVCAWTLDTVMYEDETKLIHYSWDFEVM